MLKVAFRVFQGAVDMFLRKLSLLAVNLLGHMVVLYGKRKQQESLHGSRTLFSSVA